MPGDFDLYRLLLQSSPSCFGAKHTVQVRRAGQKEHWVSEVPSSIAQKVQRKIMHLLKRREQMQQDRSVQFSWVTSVFPYAFLQRWTVCLTHIWLVYLTRQLSEALLLCFLITHVGDCPRQVEVLPISPPFLQTDYLVHFRAELFPTLTSCCIKVLILKPKTSVYVPS